MTVKLQTSQGERIAVVAGLRTPFAKQATAFHGVPAVDLGKLVVNELMKSNDVDPAIVDQLVFGQVVQMPEAPNIAREIVLGTGMNVHTDAYSVSRACATSFQSTVNVTESIMSGNRLNEQIGRKATRNGFMQVDLVHKQSTPTPV